MCRLKRARVFVALSRIGWTLAVCLGAAAGCTCGSREDAPLPATAGNDGLAPAAFDVPDAGLLPDAAPTAPDVAPPSLPRPRPRCPSDMVDIAGEFCIDRYEASLIDHDRERPLSPFFHPTRERTRRSYQYWQTQLASDAPRLALRSPAPELPVPPAWQLRQVFRPRAQSVAGVRPQGYLNGELARSSCTNAGKRLCTEAEWVRACRGERNRAYPYGDVYAPGACNVARGSHPAAILHGNASVGHRDPRLNLVEDADGPLLRRTGSRARCASRWGSDAVYDMVGNLDEWVEDPGGVFLGGFYSRQTEAGCAARVGAHPFEYYDYSLGVRCCG